jgi:hypothetical protein
MYLVRSAAQYSRKTLLLSEMLGVQGFNGRLCVNCQVCVDILKASGEIACTANPKPF